MKILAIDPGYERLGLAVLERELGKKESLVYSSCFRTDVKRAPAERLFCIGEKLEKIIVKYKPDKVATEALFLNKNQKTVMLVAGARGVLFYMATKYNLPVFEYSPTQIKLAVTGYGRSDKKQVQEMVNRLIVVPKEISFDDEYDAIAIGLTHLAHEKSS